MGAACPLYDLVRDNFRKQFLVVSHAGPFLLGAFDRSTTTQLDTLTNCKQVHARYGLWGETLIGVNAVLDIDYRGSSPTPMTLSAAIHHLESYAF